MSVLENKSVIAKELEDLAFLLNHYSICDNVEPLYTAQHECENKSNSDYWTYRLNKLIFKVGKIGHTLPVSTDNIGITLSIKIKAKYLNELNLYDSILQNPNKGSIDYFEYGFNIETNGWAEVENDVKEVFSTWHLDKDLESIGENKYFHPLYHFTYGGNKMLKKGEIYGQTLILPAPRIAHPPMDAILGIDFIIQNYMPLKLHSKLTRSLEYRTLLKNAQYRLWRPYYAAIGEHWKNTYSTIDKDLDKIKLIPNLQ